MKNIFTLFVCLAWSGWAFAQTTNKEVMQLIQAGEAAAALDKAEALVKADPDEPVNYLTRGFAFLEMKQPKRALQDFRKADTLKLNTAELHYQLGYTMNLTGDYKNAIIALDKSLKMEPKQAMAYYQRGLAYVEFNNDDMAMKDFNAALDYDSTLADAYLSRAELSYEAENFKYTIRDCNKAIQHNPKLADAYYFRAIARGGVAKDKEAIEDFNKCIELNPNHDEALNFRGSAKYLSGNKKGACADWKKAMALGNDEAENNYNSYCVSE
jgi:tetratricopeptide (TPR) repeat protein